MIIKKRVGILAGIAASLFVAGVYARGPLSRLDRIEKIFADPPVRIQPIPNSSLDMRVSRLEMDVFRLESSVRWLASDADKMDRDLRDLEARVSALESKKPN